MSVTEEHHLRFGWIQTQSILCEPILNCLCAPVQNVEGNDCWLWSDIQVKFEYHRHTGGIKCRMMIWRCWLGLRTGKIAADRARYPEGHRRCTRICPIWHHQLWHTYCNLSVRYVWIHLRVEPDIPKLNSSLSSSVLWSKVSKAADKSSATRHVASLLSVDR